MLIVNRLPLNPIVILLGFHRKRGGSLTSGRLWFTSTDFLIILMMNRSQNEHVLMITLALSDPFRVSVVRIVVLGYIFWAVGFALLFGQIENVARLVLLLKRNVTSLLDKFMKLIVLFAVGIELGVLCNPSHYSRICSIAATSVRLCPPYVLSLGLPFWFKWILMIFQMKFPMKMKFKLLYIACALLVCSLAGNLYGNGRR